MPRDRQPCGASTTSPAAATMAINAALAARESLTANTANARLSRKREDVAIGKSTGRTTLSAFLNGAFANPCVCAATLLLGLLALSWINASGLIKRLLGMLMGQGLMIGCMCIFRAAIRHTYVVWRARLGKCAGESARVLITVY